ncbi:hypothetical protein Rsub_12847 [Raphidocelis subcapitata]|uniref:F-box domain-containing protein n=1 Tax=Raphidocelis subcapitata TaxID=307507 RepID=A0A2V0PS13_9CHLO|nr:hypothetical protein Rsub_12847 [Raphidocelis subcapitata]|eukprot:GBG00106.1 hypothetical protein Rsub_12847 [Raphidocelis subcapitata]
MRSQPAAGRDRVGRKLPASGGEAGPQGAWQAPLSRDPAPPGQQPQQPPPHPQPPAAARAAGATAAGAATSGAAPASGGGAVAASALRAPAGAWQQAQPQGRPGSPPAGAHPAGAGRPGARAWAAAPAAPAAGSGCATQRVAAPPAAAGRSGGGRATAPPAAAAASNAPAPATLESLPPDVLQRVLLFGTCCDAVSLKLTSRRLCATIRRASSHWAPLVEARMQQSPYLRRLWERLGPDRAARGEAEAGAAGAAPVVAGAGSGGTSAVDWLKVWCCLERAAQGPWTLDVSQLSRRAAPHGVLLIFEVLLQHVPPSSAAADAAPQAPASNGPAAAAPAAAAAAPPAAPCGPGFGRNCGAPVVVQQHAWKDNVPLLSFSLDGRRVEVVVDTSGRVSSPQHDWCQGSLVLTPGVPRLLTLEVSYLLPVPAWFVHPAAIDEATGRLALDLSRGFGSYVTDPRYAADGGAGAAAGAGAGGTAAVGGAAGAGAGGGLQRLELCGRLAWRPSRVASFFNRFLAKGPGASCKGGGARAPSPRHGAGGGASGVSVPGCVAVGYGRGGGAAAAAAATPPPPPPPPASLHLLGVSKVAAWQVPADTEWRFAEGYLFSAEDHKAEHLLSKYGLLRPAAPPLA